MDNPESLLPVLLRFLDDIALPWRFAAIEGKSFLPGLQIENGTLLIDQARLLYPGDILHEAGHIAVTSAKEREVLNGNVGKLEYGTDGEEIVAILWSYAALRKIGLPPEVVFHPNGYRGQSQWFIDTFSSGTYVGLPLLEWMGLAASEEKAKQLNVQPFPEMLRWLRN